MSTKAPMPLRKFTVRIRPHEAEAVEAFVERMGISEAEFLRACVYASVRGELDFKAHLPPKGPVELVP
jgi:hypothetical protein